MTVVKITTSSRREVVERGLLRKVHSTHEILQYASEKCMRFEVDSPEVVAMNRLLACKIAGMFDRGEMRDCSSVQYHTSNVVFA
eukprot:scaffold162994_cov51-Attheya_sp.AAC.1